jgi:hypothetical protein
MARRRKNDVQGALVLAAIVIGGIGWLFNQGAAALNGPMGGNIVAAVAVVLGAIVCLMLLRKVIVALKEKRIRRSLVQKVKTATQQHVAALSRKRVQLLQPDAYGKLKVEKWAKELDYFISEHLRPTLTAEEQAALPQHESDLKIAIEMLVSTAIERQPTLRAFSDDMTPAEFEGYCAEELRRAGWNARVTLQSRDQGVDVVADKNGVRVVLQCKLYTGPVGNKAVQEAAAGKAHERADYGIVVSNNRYTSAAEQLAATNGVQLLHYRDLPNLDAILPPRIANRAPPIVVGRREPRVSGPNSIPTVSFDRARWDALVKRDPQIGVVANKLRPLGQKWVDKFAASYLATNDRSRLPTLVSKIIADARREFEQQEQQAARDGEPRSRSAR